MLIRLFNYGILLAVTVLLGGCPSQPVQDQGVANETTTAQPPSAFIQPADPGQSMPTVVIDGRNASSASGAEGRLNDPTSLLSQRMIYFDFDSTAIQPKYYAVLQAHADYLASFPQVPLLLEGHCDERGSREYNIALGEQRAQAVARLLSVSGASERQLTIVSYGEERPTNREHNEEAWALNRRVELIY